MKIPKSIRDIAKAEGKHVITLGVYGKFAKSDSFEMIAPACKEEANIVEEAFLRIVKMRTGDSLGRGYIVYWPSIQPEEEKEES